jgi:hypothetical protein
VTYARNISTWRSILFPYLHSRLTRHAGNKAYATYEKLVQLIEKSRGLPNGSVRRYEYQLIRSPLDAETNLHEFYPSCDFGECPSRFESHKQPKLCSRYDCHFYFLMHANSLLSDASMQSTAVFDVNPQIGWGTELYVRRMNHYQRNPPSWVWSLTPMKSLFC